MSEPQDQFDDAMFDFSSGDYPSAIAKLKAVVDRQPNYFEAQLALGMAYYRNGDYQAAIVEGHKAEKLQPREQLVHTNLSLFYMKAGDKVTAEHHGLQARIASWRTENQTPVEPSAADPELAMAKPTTPPPVKFPAMPWKRKPTP